MISIVTPTFNRAVLLEATLASVLLQQGCDFEYIVIDGGSTDHTKDLLAQHEGALAYWVSESDEGQYHAVNKGFAESKGDIMAWIGSDDVYLPWTFNVVKEIFDSHPEVRWITTLYPLTMDVKGRVVACQSTRGYSERGFFRGENLPGAEWPALGGWIQQESTFWRRSLWEEAGGYLDEKLNLAADFELWARFFRLAPLHGVATPLAAFRSHGDQRSSTDFGPYIGQAKAVLEAQAGQLPSRIAAQARDRLRRHVPERLRGLRELTTIDDPRSGIFFDSESGKWFVRRI